MENNSSRETSSENPVSDILEKKIFSDEMKAGLVIDNMVEKIENEMRNADNWDYESNPVRFTYNMTDTEKKPLIYQVYGKKMERGVIKNYKIWQKNMD